jgi:hypothetical protein
MASLAAILLIAKFSLVEKRAPPSPITGNGRTSTQCGGHLRTTPPKDPEQWLFPCSRCGCVEDTALCHFWSARLREMPTVCSACDPTIGKWHGEFPQELARDWATDERGFLLWHRKHVEDWLGQPIEIIGKLSPPAVP